MKYGLTSCGAALGLLALTGGAYQSGVTANWKIQGPSTELPAGIPETTASTDFDSGVGVVNAFDPPMIPKVNLVNTGSRNTPFVEGLDAIPTAIVFHAGSPPSWVGGMPPSWVAGISATPFGTFSHGMDMTGSIGTDMTGGNGPDTPLMPAVPEPSTWIMMVLGFAGLGFMAYRRRNSRLPAV
jgi:hypothetical protein